MKNVIRDKLNFTHLQYMFSSGLFFWSLWLIFSYTNVFSQQDSIIDVGSSTRFHVMIDEITSDAIAGNPGLKAAAFTVTVDRERAGTIGYDAPQAAVEFFQAPIRSFPNPFKDQMEIDYSLQQMIPFPGKLKSMSDAEKVRVKMSEADQLQVRQNLIYSVHTTFYELYLIDRKLAVNSSNQLLLKSLVDIARKQYELGMESQTDILKAQTEQSRLLSDSINLVQSRQTMVAMLNSYRNAGAEQSIPSIPEISPAAFDVLTFDSLLSLAHENRPDLRSMHSNVEMQSAERKAAEKEFLPDFMIRGTYKQMIDKPDDWAIMVGASIPVAPWTIDRNKSSIRQLEAMHKRAEAEYQTMENMIASQVKDAQARVISSQAQIDLIQNTTIPQARQAMQAALAGYQTGKQDFIMLLDTQRMLRMAELDYQMAVMNLLTNHTYLEKVTGTLK
jgi:outer membrane protein TolC